MADQLSTYSFLDFHAAIVGPGGGFSLGGDGAGSAAEGISVSFSEDADKMDVGADGAAMHSLNASKAGKATVHLLKTSPVNALLSAMYNFQRGSSATWGQNTITLSNIATGDVYTCQQVAFTKFPDNTWGKEGPMLSWEFNAAIIDPLLGSGSPSI